jgi:hypothetical protein
MVDCIPMLIRLILRVNFILLMVKDTIFAIRAKRVSIFEHHPKRVVFLFSKQDFI